MTFTLLSPQKTRNSEGYIVQVADRHSVEYIGDGESYVVSVDFGVTVGLYAATLAKAGGVAQSPIPPDERLTIVSRIKAGLEAMGSKVDVV